VENVTIAEEAAVVVEETLEETAEESVTIKPLDAKEVFKDCTFSEQSILFGIHADMGLLSANDIGIPSVKHASEYPQIELASHTTILQGQVDQVDTFKLTQEQLGSIPAEFFGIAMDLQFWPWYLGSDSQLSFQAGASFSENFGNFFSYHFLSAMAWDIPRAIFTSTLLIVAGAPVLHTLRRAHTRARFLTPIEFRTLSEREKQLAASKQLPQN
jgi:hypothetical protein